MAAVAAVVRSYYRRRRRPDAYCRGRGEGGGTGDGGDGPVRAGRGFLGGRAPEFFRIAAGDLYVCMYVCMYVCT